MDTLDDTHWDVVIAGTGLLQSLVALSLSRSKKKILHLDPHPYYGGSEAALSLDEAQAWAKAHAGDNHHTFRHASITIPDFDGASDTEGPKLGSSRAYSLALAPQFVYARSNIVPALVTSQTHSQLEFQAVGAWFLVGSPTTQDSAKHSISKVPSSREDVFHDTSLNPRMKRALMKFLHFVAAYEEGEAEWQEELDKPFAEVVERRFGLPAVSIEPLLALTCSRSPANETRFGVALPAIARHLKSIGTFGPGFSAVLPKWGGLSELAQVGCRACAVGGGVYVLNKSFPISEQSPSDGALRLTLGDGEKITTQHLVSSHADLESVGASEQASVAGSVRRIAIVSSPLPSLFPPTSEGGVVPAGAVLVIPSADADSPPVHILVHSSESGECPSTQCILYASVLATAVDPFKRLDEAISAVLSSVVEATSSPHVLWQMQYQHREETLIGRPSTNSDPRIVTLSSLAPSLVLEDDVLDNVKAAWSAITKDDVNDFLQFEDREPSDGDDE